MEAIEWLERPPSEAQQVFLVSPQDRPVLLDVDAGHDVVQMDDDILRPVSHDHDETALLLLLVVSAFLANMLPPYLDAIADQRRNAGIAAERSAEYISSA